MAYTQLFNLLCEKVDGVYGGRLPVHVQCLLDEFANIGQIPKFENLTATIRNREISSCLVLQAQSQLKALYKDNADTIIGNCDSTIFLSGTCILQLRGVRLFLSDKYDITKHPNYKYLSDYDPHNAFPIEKFLSTQLKTETGRCVQHVFR
jgi:hypothetical protein